eukprot:403375815
MGNILYYKEYNHDSHPLYMNAGDHGRFKKIETCAKNKLVSIKVAKMPFDFLLR